MAALGVLPDQLSAFAMTPAIPAGKVEAVAMALCRAEMPHTVTVEARDNAGMRALAEVAIRAAAAYDAQQRAAAGPRPARERDTDAWWAD